MRHTLMMGLAAIMLLPAAPASAQADEERVLACGGELDRKTLSVERTNAICDWPFDVQKMQIRCNSFGPNSGEVYFVSEKGAFAMNGNAKQSYDDPRPIWLDQGEAGMGKVNVGPWIDAGLALC